MTDDERGLSFSTSHQKALYPSAPGHYTINGKKHGGAAAQQPSTLATSAWGLGWCGECGGCGGQWCEVREG